jgi:hypothetical protein
MWNQSAAPAANLLTGIVVARSGLPQADGTPKVA